MNVFKSLGYALLGLLLWACAKDGEQREQRLTPKIETNAQGQRVLNVSLSGLEVGFDEEALKSLELPEELRAVNYQFNWRNRFGIQKSALEDGDEVLLSMLFNYDGSTEKPLIAEDIPFVWNAQKKLLVMKEKNGARVQLLGEVDSEGNRDLIPSGSDEEKQAVLGKNWCYALVYKPRGTGFDNGSLLVTAPTLEAYKRASQEDEEPSTEKHDGTPTNGKIDLGGFPFASKWMKFDMAKLLEYATYTEEEKKGKPAPLPTAEGLAPRGYFFMLSFKNEIPGNQRYQITKIRVKSQYVSFKGQLDFVPPKVSSFGNAAGDPISYSSSYGDTGWHYTLGNHAEILAQGEAGRYYFLWGIFTHGQSPNYTPKIKVEVEGRPLDGAGETLYSFPWYEKLPKLAGGKNNSGKTLLYRLKGKDPNAPTPPNPTPNPGTGSSTPPSGNNEVLNPFDYFSSNYVRSEDAVRSNQVANEVGEHERTKVQGVSTNAFYASHSGNGNILRTSTWTPKANALPNGRRWSSLTDWTTFIPLSNASRTLASKYDPNFDTDIYRQLNKWWNIKVANHPNFTKKVRRTLNDLDKQNIPQKKNDEHGRTVYEVTGSKELVSIHTNSGSNYTMALDAEYIAHTDNGVKNTVFYGKRFMGSHDLASLRVENRPVRSDELNNPADFQGTTAEQEIAKRFPENAHLSAWRYELTKEGNKYTGITMTIKVKYVFLGQHRANETIENIGTEAWWAAEDAKGNVREMHLRTPRYHRQHNAVPHLTTSYYQNDGVAFFIDDDAVWYESIPNFTTNTSTDYYLKLAIDPTSSASGLGGN